MQQLTAEQYEFGKRMHNAILARGDIPCCIVCEHFNSAEEHCRFWDARPPADTIVMGCQQFSFMPF